MNISPVIAAAKEELEAIYKDLHAHPELGFEETRTSEIVAEKLAEYGVDEVHTGLGKTCLLYTSPSPRDYAASRMPSSA